MRKDVKLGFAIGGILLAVLVVYVLVISGNSNEKPVPVALATADQQAKPTKAPATAPAAASADANKQGRTRRNQSNPQYSQTADASKPAEQPAAVAVRSEKSESAAGATDPFKSPTPSTKPAASDAVAANTPARADDRWTAALQTGVPVLMTSTPSTAAPAPTATPTPSASATPSASSEVTSSDVYSSAHIPPAVKPIMASSASNTPAAILPASQLPVRSAPATRPTGYSNSNNDSFRSTSNNETRTAAVPTPAADARTHLVQSGETFSSIASVVYGSAAYYPHLLRANPNVDPKKLKAGMTIVLPPAGDVRADVTSNAVATAAIPAAAPALAAPQKLDEKSEYRVESGDNLYKISAKLYGKIDRVEKIYEMNKAAIGPDKTKIKVGMVLKLPEAPTAKVQ